MLSVAAPLQAAEEQVNTLPVAEPTTPPLPGVPEKEPARAVLRVRQIQSIEFGTFACDRGGGSVTITTSGARIPSGNISLLNSGISGAADFEIVGQPGEIVTIYLPERVILGKNGDGGDTEITNLTMAPEPPLTLDSRGYARVKVGGTMRLAGRTSLGSYYGRFDLDVRYLR